MEIAVIDNNNNPMVPDRGRGLGFVQSLEDWSIGSDYDFFRYDTIPVRRSELLRCRGLILSGSGVDFARADGSFDRDAYEKMAALFQLIRDFQGPVLGICFGHQLMALAEEFDHGRTRFGGLLVRNMPSPARYLVMQVRIEPALRFLDQKELWVQSSHKQEVVLSDDLLKYFDILSGSDQCLVQVMQHRRREWFGVQFHPEVGKETEAGRKDMHLDAIRDGKALLTNFVKYCRR